MDQKTAQRIIRCSLDGDLDYPFEAIGQIGQDINDMSAETMGRLVDRALVDTDVAIYDCDSHWELVADCNGPIAVTVIK
jgi:hypothetical protein